MIMQDFDFSDLFTYDLANNHQGDIEHALNIIEALGDVNRKAGVRGALKFQFRQLETFIHPDYKEKKDIKHIPRFMETALTKQQYGTLTEAVRKNGMHTMCTPFDEESLDVILDLDVLHRLQLLCVVKGDGDNDRLRHPGRCSVFPLLLS